LPLVLASNEANATDRYDWKDITGVQYHYPNGYRNMIRPGEPFVYYRGIRRAGGGRGQAEYFGRGVIGDIWRDPRVPPNAPKRKWAWYCGVEDFVPFTVPVPAKVEGVFFEKIGSTKWRNGVRPLSEEDIERILAAAGVPPGGHDVDSWPSPLKLPKLAVVRIEEILSDLMVPQSVQIDGPADTECASRRGGGMRRSRIAKAIGHRAEEIALRYVHEAGLGATQIRHVAISSETPGWDIEYIDPTGELNAVEVKGSSGAAFPNFEFTDGELTAARRLGPRYWIYLVANCLGTRPRLYRIQDPAALLSQGLLCAAPLAWRIWRS
jgi:hypothetical protein